jgi:Holliday junction resolvase RusA-like endonuclease
VNISLTIPGNPVGKQRARVTRQGHTYTPQKTVNYEAFVKQTFAAKYPDFMPIPGPVRMILSIYLMESKETQRKLKKGIRVYPTIKPDISNVLKSIEDALNGLAYVDDKQIISVYAEKKYSHRPCVEIIVAEP